MFGFFFFLSSSLKQTNIQFFNRKEITNNEIINIECCIFSNIVVSNLDGGGIYISNSSPIFILNCLFFNIIVNSNGLNGGAISISGFNSTLQYNCIHSCKCGGHGIGSNQISSKYNFLYSSSYNNCSSIDLGVASWVLRGQFGIVKYLNNSNSLSSNRESTGHFSTSDYCLTSFINYIKNIGKSIFSPSSNIVLVSNNHSFSNFINNSVTNFGIILIMKSSHYFSTTNFINNNGVISTFDSYFSGNQYVYFNNCNFSSSSFSGSYNQVINCYYNLNYLVSINFEKFNCGILFSNKINDKFFKIYYFFSLIL